MRRIKILGLGSLSRVPNLPQPQEGSEAMRCLTTRGGCWWELGVRDFTQSRTIVADTSTDIRGFRTLLNPRTAVRRLRGIT